MAVFAVACAVVLAVSSPIAAPAGRVSLAQMASNSHYGVRGRVTMLMEEKKELSEEDVRFLKHYDQCQSCLVKCDHYEENNCDSFEPKKECEWEQVMEGCEDCKGKGCGPVVEYIAENEALNATYGDNEEAKAAAVDEMAWRDACAGAVDDFSKFETCIHEASTVAHAEGCLKQFLHPMPANMLNLAKKIAKTVGPPTCAMSYTGHECEPSPSPEDNEGTCPQGFMCMPDPAKCESCACSCNTPADKLKNLEGCLSKAANPHAGAFCLATFFSQLPPEFVEAAIEAASQPEGVDEHYAQILAACGGDENGTEVVTKCLEQVEYCVRPLQGKAGTFPEDESKYQGICECFRDEDVLKHCAVDADENKTGAAECAGAISEHYVYHVHHTYCKDQTEAACNFQCEWPLPGFFGDVAKKAEEALKEQKKEEKEKEKEAKEAEEAAAAAE
uniref:GCK domain-containing protein n=2 Tax=Hemiselmis andersenii TaxID=464988 RepID=A0A6U2EM89_HEMAN